MNNEMKFYDTCSLLIAGESLFEKGEKFIVSSITFNELERIKTANNKDPDIKYAARLLLHLFEQHPDMYEVVVHKKEHEEDIEVYGFDITDDTRILSDAINCHSANIFVTNDLALKHIAKTWFDDKIESIKEEQDDYNGCLEVLVDDESLADFYQDINNNIFRLKVGQYLLLKKQKPIGHIGYETLDIRVWDGTTHRYLKYSDFNSKWFGKIKPYQNDPYQKMAFDSLSSNQITMLKGPAGSGKTYIALGYLMNRLEKNAIDKIIIFCNTVATANSAKLGYLPGTKDEKLLDSQIGNLLVSKFGGRDGVEQLINSEKLVLLPMSDIRGYDTSGMRAGIYISEAQNLDRTLIKLALQRVGEDCICIIDGDEKTQVDDVHFSGANNGMRRVSKVYRGSDIYGEVQLHNIYRSKIAKIAEQI